MSLIIPFIPQLLRSTLQAVASQTRKHYYHHVLKHSSLYLRPSSSYQQMTHSCYGASFRRTRTFSREASCQPFRTCHCRLYVCDFASWSLKRLTCFDFYDCPDVWTSWSLGTCQMVTLSGTSFDRVYRAFLARSGAHPRSTLTGQGACATSHDAYPSSRSCSVSCERGAPLGCHGVCLCARDAYYRSDRPCPPRESPSQRQPVDLLHSPGRP